MVRGTAEEALPAGRKIEIRPAHRAPFVQIVGGLVVIRRSALEQDDAVSAPAEFSGDRDSGRARADDADIGGKGRTSRDCGSVNQHEGRRPQEWIDPKWVGAYRSRIEA